MLDFATILLGVATTLLLLWFYRRRTRTNLPPSPFEFPIIGSMPFVKIGTMHETFTIWAQRFGEIFCCHMGPELMVSLNEYDLVKEVLGSTSDDFAARPHFFLIDLARTEKEPFAKGIVLNDGRSWKVHRKFAQKTFRQFGVGTSEFEDIVLEEAADLINDFKSQNNQPFFNDKFVKKAVANVIAYLLFGSKFHGHDQTLWEIANFIEKTSESNMANAAALNAYPWLRFIPPFRGVYEMLKNGVLNNYKNMQLLIDQRGERAMHLDEQSYTDAFLLKMNEKTTLNEDSKFFTDRQLLNCLGDLFAAGFSTTAVTLKWVLLYLASYTDLQERIFSEIDAKVGRQRPVRLSDQPDVPLLEAAILEVQRTANVVPFALPRRATKTSTIKGYHIPKNALIMPNIWYIHRDPKNFYDPLEFKPERFLQNGKIFIPETFIPFGIGTRSCPGENLAKMELFLFLGAILQHFRITLPPETVPNLTPKTGSAYDTFPYQMIATLRFQ